MSEYSDAHRQLRRALGSYPTGVTVITTKAPNGLYVGLTANSFTSISLDPPIVLWSLRSQSPSYPLFAAAQSFCINILSEQQADLSRQFATPLADKFRGVAFAEGLDGVPVLADAMAHFECARTAEYKEGDHVIFLGSIQHYETREDQRPLVFFGGGYKAIQELQESVL